MLGGAWAGTAWRIRSKYRYLLLSVPSSLSLAFILPSLPFLRIVGTAVHYWIASKPALKPSVSFDSVKDEGEGGREQPDDDMLLLHSADQDCAAVVPPCLAAECLPFVVREDGIADGSTETAQRTHAFSVGMGSHTEYL
ncbi:hypothetical protein CH63R_09060 [Colletotrichum higginsianum IMI 349063]|uniref:Uncharacterized protein n=1 Tax=Colletotrichum higginsianum (strain IMI 349063) TaxID=759273 RepID=A0A1B7Y662_COLHI|nr:hypothetical protein CH63R_09060 [Colletotrichum higginsianum IMI 349063]OBR07539.1 hypothetical protein CH63R_09060 [Colletotrichum higginsianum IMI 349063]